MNKLEVSKALGLVEDLRSLVRADGVDAASDEQLVKLLDQAFGVLDSYGVDPVKQRDALRGITRMRSRELRGRGNDAQWAQVTARFEADGVTSTPSVEAVGAALQEASS